LVLAEVTDFVTLARDGAYMYGDRRVSPTERTRWRLTFKRLAEDTADRLAEWHQALFDRLAGGPEEGLLDRLLTHEALSGPELTLLRARLALRRGDAGAARELVSIALKRLPGHQGLLSVAADLGAGLPVRP
jgi:hypothetical protein